MTEHPVWFTLALVFMGFGIASITRSAVRAVRRRRACRKIAKLLDAKDAACDSDVHRRPGSNPPPPCKPERGCFDRSAGLNRPPAGPKPAAPPAPPPPFTSMAGCTVNPSPLRGVSPIQQALARLHNLEELASELNPLTKTDAQEAGSQQISSREKALMFEAFRAGDDSGASNSVNKGRRYSFYEWLASGFLQELMACSPRRFSTLTSDSPTRYWVFAGDMWDAGTDKERAARTALSLGRRHGVRRMPGDANDAPEGKWFYLVEANGVQEVRHAPKGQLELAEIRR